MFGIDSPELLVIAVVALVVIGPKELPGLLRGWGKWMTKMRGMASEFRGHVDEMVRQSELDEVKKQIVDTTNGLDLKALDPTREIKSALNEGMAEGEKALADAQDNLAKPVPEIAADGPSAALETASGTAPETVGGTIAETAPSVEPAPVLTATTETTPSTEPEAAPSPAPVTSAAEPLPPKSAAAG
jgi:sec-independent protein translocase protein TatB